MKKPVSLPLAHMCALATVGVWGVTFIASKYLLEVYTPVQILLMRFLLAYVMLWIIYPRMPKVSLKDELCFIIMGFFGNSLYFLLENTALVHTYSSNVSIILSAAPVFTAVLAHFTLREERLQRQTVYGSLIAFFGVILVIFNGTVILKLSPLGDILAVLSALSWAIYSILLKKKTAVYDGFFLARRVILWGIITGFPMLLLQPASFSLIPLKDPLLLGCLLFLGLLGSALCYIFWNMAVFRLGAVTTNNYIFLQPFITMLCAAILLDEPVSLMGFFGALLIVGGIVLANRKSRSR